MCMLVGAQNRQVGQHNDTRPQDSPSSVESDKKVETNGEVMDEASPAHVMERKMRFESLEKGNVHRLLILSDKTSFFAIR